jgi:hypothetical protein
VPRRARDVYWRPCELISNGDGSYRWIDGVGNQASAQVHSGSINLRFKNGTLAGKLRENCETIYFNERHWAIKPIS